MESKIKLYKELTIAMLESLQDEDYEGFDLLIEEREGFIKVLIANDEIESFKLLYDREKLRGLELEIKSLLDRKIQDTKKEIKEYKVSIQGNKLYNNIKKENLNIFSISSICFSIVNSNFFHSIYSFKLPLSIDFLGLFIDNTIRKLNYVLVFSLLTSLLSYIQLT